MARRKTRRRTAYKKTKALGKVRLEEERKSLLGKIERLRENVKVELEFEADEGDPELPQREKNLSLIATFKERLKEIDLALEELKLGGDRYGICLQCNKRIPSERLALFPEARYCVPCKEKLERRSRRYPRSAWRR